MTALASIGTQVASGEPFGFPTVPAPHNRFAKEWRNVRDAWAIEHKMLDRCRIDREGCPSRSALQFLAVIDDARFQIGRARLGHVNRAINLKIRSMSDLRNYGVPEKWTAPLATFSNGAGDCTDYAIAKYFALGEIGISANNRRLVVVRFKLQHNMLHTVLAVRENQHWWILDNRRMSMIDAANDTEYFPLLEFSNRGVRRYKSVLSGM